SVTSGRVTRTGRWDGGDGGGGGEAELACVRIVTAESRSLETRNHWDAVRMLRTRSSSGRANELVDAATSRSRVIWSLVSPSTPERPRIVSIGFANPARSSRMLAARASSRAHNGTLTGPPTRPKQIDVSMQ